MPRSAEDLRWPALPWEPWKDTAATLHMWTQIVGKVRLARTPSINHSWHVTLYVTPRGLTTGSIPHDARSFRLDFDFLAHELLLETSDGARRAVELVSRTTADFYAAVREALAALDVPVEIHPRPNEVDPAIPFAEDELHAAYDPDAANRFWRVLLQVDRVFTRFRARFRGKASPPHFFWGSFDHAVTRFSGRPAPPHPGGMPNVPLAVMQEAYSHELSSAGFWPGGAAFPEPIFYSYAYPTPEGFGAAAVRPAAARWSDELGEFVLPYEAVRTAPNPEQALLEFLESTYVAAADAAGWDRSALEVSFER